jgi:ABC-type oligopeptide transport system substrate-binding subunit/predicted Ser/Thr protein kinase
VEQVAGRYQIISELGRGGMGVVYLAHDPVLHRNVAVKVLTDASLGPEGRARLLKEAQAAAHLNHPNIVTIFDAGEDQSSAFIVMEAVEGTLLSAWHVSETLDIIRMASQVCDALAHAHSHGIVHRDLKPDNIIVTSDHTVKLMDFGLARDMSTRSTSSGIIVGTVFYLAPEQALGERVDHRADLYSLGVILYELTAGCLPFGESTSLAVISQHLHATPVPPSTHNPSLPASLEGVILRLMSKDPRDRPPSALEVKAELLQPAHTRSAGLVLRPDTTRIRRGRMIGRETEFARANHAWQQATLSQPQVLLLSGDAGVGKTTLLHELEALALVSGGQYLSGQCYSEAAAPYEPLAQILSTSAQSRHARVFDELPPRAMFCLGHIAPRLFHDLSRRPSLDQNPASRHELSDGWMHFCAAVASRRPLLLAVEDAHWADSGTLEVLRHLIRRSPKTDLPILLVITYRNADPVKDSDFTALIAEIVHGQEVVRVNLAPFDLDNTRQTIASMLQGQPPAGLPEAIFTHTEGNPLFIEEVCKALVDEGALLFEAGDWKVTGNRSLPIPETLRLAIRGRMKRLPEPAQEVLLQAAVLGREFDYGLLRAATRLEDNTLLESLGRAAEAQFIHEIPPALSPTSRSDPAFAFVHALVPPALLDGMMSVKRRRLHLFAAEALQGLFPDRLDELAGRLGNHFAEAGEWDQAIGHLLRAGASARKVYAIPEAINAYEEASSFLGRTDRARDAGQALLTLALLYQQAFRNDEASATYRRAFAAWRHLPPAPSRSTAYASRPLRLSGKLPPSLDPQFSLTTSSGTIACQLFSGLVEATPDLGIAPSLAREWDILDGGRKYHFHLRTDCTWSDGAPVTAQDVEFAWKRALDPKLDAPAARWLLDLKGARAFHDGKDPSPETIRVRATDTFTLEVELAHPVGHFLHLLAASNTFPIPRHTVEALGTGWAHPSTIVTNGPFRLEGWVDDRIVLVRNESYRCASAGNVGRVEYVQSSGSQEDYDFFIQGHVDIAAPPAKYIHRHLGEIITFPIGLTFYLALNMNTPPFDTLDARRAISHALNRPELANLYDPESVPALGGFVPPSLPGHLPGVALSHDPDLARALWHKATEGLEFGPQPFELACIKNTNLGGWISNLISQLHATLGINIRLSEAEAPYNRLETDPPEMHVNSWLADFPDPDDFLHMGVRTVLRRGQDPLYDEIIDHARATQNLKARLGLYHEAERRLADQAALIPLLYDNAALLIKPWIRSFPLSPIRFWFWKDVILDDPPPRDEP